MNSVLYRKYRSRNFKEILGQDYVVDILINSIIQNKLSHAYLFCGPRGVGKTSLARVLAKAVNCLNFNKLNDVCNNCVNCNLINSGRSVDLIEIDAASNRRIDDIRNIIEGVNYLPVNLNKKVFIMDEIHMLTKEAFNAFLKTLEEPPNHVIFILATTEPNKVPITVLSRVTRLDLSLIEKSKVILKLSKILEDENIKFEVDALNLIYELSEGSLRDAETILGKVINSLNNTNLINTEVVYRAMGITSSKNITEFVNLLLKNDYLESKKYLTNLISYDTNFQYLIESMLVVLKNKLLDTLNKPTPSEYGENNYDTANKITRSPLEFTPNNDTQLIHKLIMLLLELKESLKHFLNKALAFEIFFIKYFFGDTNKNKNISNGNNQTINVTNQNLIIDQKDIKRVDDIDISNLGYNNQELFPHDDLKNKFLNFINKENIRLYKTLLQSDILIDNLNNEIVIDINSSAKILLDNNKYIDIIKKAYKQLKNHDAVRVIVNYKETLSKISNDNGYSKENENINNILFVSEKLQRDTNLKKLEDNSDIIENYF